MTTNELDPRNQEEDPRNPKILNREVFYKGKYIIRQGEDGVRAYYIENGRVEVLIKDGEHELKVTELKSGDVFGEMALINKEVRSASVRAVEDTTVTVISLEEIEGKIKSIQDDAIRAIINVLAERLRESTKGQLDHYKNLADFQDRVSGIVEQVDLNLDEEQKQKFQDEVTPLLEDLQRVLDRYSG